MNWSWYYLKTHWILKKKLLLEYLNPISNNSAILFIIITQPRAGSTLLHTYLNSHPNIKSYGERPRRLKKRYGDEAILSPKQFFPFRTSLPIRSVGLKISIQHYNDPFYDPFFNWIIENKDLRIVMLTRKNLARSFLSLNIAQKTQQWSSNKNPVSPHEKKITFHLNEFESFKKEIAEMSYTLLNKLKDHKMIKINYEDLIDSPESLMEIQVLLQVKPRNLFTLLHKQNPEQAKDLIENWEEVKEVFNKYDMSNI